MFRATAMDAHHPFGRELEQLDEIVEEFGGVVRDAAREAEGFGGVVRDAAWEADEAVMRKKGLKRFCADDYMADLTGLFAHYFAPPVAASRPVGWI
jgi:hypothetical protein